MSTKLTGYLKEQVETASAELSDITPRRMFGCDAFFHGGSIFALIWKTGRIGLKITDPSLFKTLMSVPGAAPWTAGPKTMSNWVLVPEDFHDDVDQLRQWTKTAYKLAGAGEKPKSSPLPKRKAAPKPRSQQ